MRNKVFTILGILLIIATVGSYFLFDINIKQQSQIMGSDILIAKTNIPEGTIIRSIEEAYRYFGVRRIAQSDVVPSSISVRTVKKEQDGILNKIKSFFTASEELQIVKEDLVALVNKKITADIYKNQQVLSIYLSSDITEFEENERLFAVPTSYVDSVGAEIAKDDYVDLWVHYGAKHPKGGASEKIIEALKVVKVKGENNKEINDGDGSGNETVPNLVIFKMTEEQIAIVREKMYEGSIFLTKWGKKPSTEARIVLDKMMEENEEQYFYEENETGENEGSGAEEFFDDVIRPDDVKDLEENVAEQGGVSNDE